MADVQTTPESGAFFIEARPDGKQLRKSGDRGGVKLRVGDLNRRARQGRRLLLARACAAGSSRRILDATAGFGLDGLTLHRLGCRVDMCERDPMIFELLCDACTRLAPDALGSDIRLFNADAASLLRGRDVYDVVYLDPMFPDRRKTALPNKRARYLGELLGSGDHGYQSLLTKALASAARRVVVKRRRHDPAIGTPDFVLTGRSVRFDVYQAAS